MSKQLIESIIDDNLVSANDIFHDRMGEIVERKLYEAKRMMQAELNEATGGLSPTDIEARKKAGFRRASEVYPTDEVSKSPAARRLASQGKKKKQPEGDIRTKLGQLGKEWKKASFGERKKAVQMVHQAAQKFAAGEQPPKKTTVTPTETPAPTAAKPAMDMSKMKRQEPPAFDVSKMGQKAMTAAKFTDKVKKLRPKKDDIITRYRTGLEKAKELQSRGSSGSVSRFKKAYGLKAMPAQAASGFSIIKKGFDAIAQTAGS